jgi:hypothetical protein
MLGILKNLINYFRIFLNPIFHFSSGDLLSPSAPREKTQKDPE